ncbi:MAG: hypothetical protein ACC628_02760 [Pirellulaceae bacterium]
MELELLNTSVVVIAQDHNPTILHPAFLTSQEIVPEDWQVADVPLCTPAFSLAKYKNGITFNVESNRLVVTEEKTAGNPENSKIAELAISYAKKLPHVRYKATGVNFNGFCLCKDPEQFLIARFLREGPWNDEPQPMKALGTRFLYAIEGAVLRFGLDGGQVNRGGEPEPAILVSGNFHVELPNEKPLEALERLLSRWSERRDQFARMCTMILGMEQ